MRPGVRLGVDVGSVRVGVAVSDATAALVLPVGSLARDASGGADLVELARLVADRDAVEVIVGLPLGLDGQEGHAAAAARDYALTLAGRIAPIPVRLVDERFSTAEAVRTLQPRRGRPDPGRTGSGRTGSGRTGSGRTGSGRAASGRAGSGRSGSGRAGGPHLDSRALRSVVDAEAAAIIVRTALAEEAATGTPPGQPVQVVQK